MVGVGYPLLARAKKSFIDAFRRTTTNAHSFFQVQFSNPIGEMYLDQDHNPVTFGEVKT